MKKFILILILSTIIFINSHSTFASSSSNNNHKKSRTVDTNGLLTPKSVDENPSDLPFFCSTVTQCKKQPCQQVDCINNKCIYSDAVCEIHPDPCVVSDGCDMNTGFCSYRSITCNDNDPCTVDRCLRVLPTDTNNNNTQSLSSSSSYTSVCDFTPITGCINKYAHSADIEIVQHSNVEIQTFIDQETNEEIYQICAISTYPNLENTAVIATFEPYLPCTLDQLEKSTCDTHLFVDVTQRASKIDYYCVNDASPNDDYQECRKTTERYTLWMPEFSESLILLPTTNRLLFNKESQQLELLGSLYDPNNLLIRLEMELIFSNPSTSSSSSPTISSCLAKYKDQMNLAEWQYFQEMKGRLMAVPNTPLEGLEIELTGIQFSTTQMGIGANGKNMNMGMHTYFTWQVVQQPFNTYYTIPNVSRRKAEFSIDFYQKPDGSCNIQELDYCDYFDSLNTNWETTVSQNKDTVLYCSNFTLEDLLGCRSYYPTLDSDQDQNQESLFQITNMNDKGCEETNSCAVRYDGTLYHTFIRNDRCADNTLADLFEGSDSDSSSITCKEQSLSVQHNISFTLKVGGETEVMFVRNNRYDFDVQWTGNIWMAGEENGGNIRITLMTRIADPELQLMLGNPQILSAIDPQDGVERIQFQFDTLAPSNCIPSNNDNSIEDKDVKVCYQAWTIESVNANEFSDLSSLQSLSWDVFQFENITTFSLLSLESKEEEENIQEQLLNTINIIEEQIEEDIESSNSIVSLALEEYSFRFVNFNESIDMERCFVYTNFSKEGTDNYGITRFSTLKEAIQEGDSCQIIITIPFVQYSEDEYNAYSEQLENFGKPNASQLYIYINGFNMTDFEIERQSRELLRQKQKEIIAASPTDSTPTPIPVQIQTEKIVESYRLETTLMGSVFTDINFAAARNDGLQAHRDGKISAALDLYKDREMITAYDFTEPLIDNEYLFGSLCLTNHRHLDILLRDISLCFSTERDLIPHDPNSENRETGCSTPGSDVQHVLLYSHDNYVESTIDESIHEFGFLANRGMGLECDRFAFKVHAYTPYAQTLKVRWAAQEVGGHGVLVEMISEFHRSEGAREVSRHVEHDDEDSSFFVDCPGDDWFFDWDEHHCRHHEWHDDEVFWTLFAILIFVLFVGCCFCAWRTHRYTSLLSSLEQPVMPSAVPYMDFNPSSSPMSSSIPSSSSVPVYVGNNVGRRTLPTESAFSTKRSSVVTTSSNQSLVINY